MSRSLKTLILLSLLVNLLLMGYLFGHTGRCLMGGRQMHPGLHELVKALPEEKRAPAQASLDRFQSETAELHKKLSDARKTSAKLLAAQPFDKAAYMAQVQEMGQLRLQMTQRMADAVATLAQQCTPEQRQTLADMLRRPHRRTEDE